jgi:hypothetical protein
MGTTLHHNIAATSTQARMQNHTSLPPRKTTPACANLHRLLQNHSRTYEDANQFIFRVQVHAAGVEPVQVRLLTAAAAGMNDSMSYAWCVHALHQLCSGGCVGDNEDPSCAATAAIAAAAAAATPAAGLEQ